LQQDITNFFPGRMNDPDDKILFSTLPENMGAPCLFYLQENAKMLKKMPEFSRRRTKKSHNLTPVSQTGSDLCPSQCPQMPFRSVLTATFSGWCYYTDFHEIVAGNPLFRGILNASDCQTEPKLRTFSNEARYGLLLGRSDPNRRPN